MNEIHRMSDEAIDEIRRATAPPARRPEMITRNSERQPFARFEDDAVVLTVFDTRHSRRIFRLSAAKAEELAIELEHAAKMMRGEI